MSRALNDLEPPMRAKAIELLARCAEAGAPVLIINTRRTEAEQRLAVSTGHSWVNHSKHQDGAAIDICPYQQYTLHGADKLEWNGSDPVWERIGKIGEDLGLRWGGRWTQRDLGHFELP